MGGKTKIEGNGLFCNLFSSALFGPNSTRLLYFICSANLVCSITYDYATDFRATIASSLLKSNFGILSIHVGFKCRSPWKSSLNDSYSPSDSYLCYKSTGKTLASPCANEHVRPHPILNHDNEKQNALAHHPSPPILVPLPITA